MLREYSFHSKTTFRTALIGRLNCFAFAQGGSIDLTLQRLGGTRVEVRLAHALPRGRGRINCTMPADDDRWRWFGMQYYVPAR